MNPMRSCVPAVGLVVCILWAALAWLVPDDLARHWAPSLLWHRIVPVVLGTVLVIHLFLAVVSERSRGA